jgi:hypothetical protein
MKKADKCVEVLEAETTPGSGLQAEEASSNTL